MVQGRAWRLEHCEGAARALLDAAFALGGSAPTDLIGLVSALKMRFGRRGGSGCKGALHVVDRKIRWNPRGIPSEALFDLAHELGHLAGLLTDESYPHDERGADLTGLAVAISRERMIRAIGPVGLHRPDELIRAVPELPARWVLLRAAWVRDRPCAIWHGGSRMAFAPDDQEVPCEDFCERYDVRVALATGLPQRSLYGDVAIPYGPSDERGVLFLPRDRTGR